ncbi:MAG: AsmA family protein [Epibacterium sp.]|nr:AsmA family protein [Epibacterium sp.]NQX72271.1 AsmA family protein [Epibacterium sp.]
MRLILRFLSVVVITAVLAVGVLLMLPGQKLAQIAARQIEAQTGREVRFDGDVRFMFWPVLGLRANDVTLANAPWAGPQPILTAGRLNIGVDAAALLGGEVRITELTAIVPELNLATNADGVGNWELGALGAAGDGTPATEVAGAVPFSIETLSVSGARLTYAPHGGDVVVLDQVDVALDWPKGGAAALSATLRPHGEPLSIAGTVQAFEAFLAGQASDVDLRLMAAGAAGAYQGQLSLNGAVQGKLTAQVPSTDALARAFGVAAPDLPEGLGQAMALSSDVSFDPIARQIDLQALTLQLDGNALEGAAEVAFSAPLHVTADLTAGTLVIPASAGGGHPGAPSGEGGWSTAVIDASALSLFNGRIAIAFDSLDYGGVVLGASRIATEVDRARAVVTMAPLSAFGGRVDGQVIANNRAGLSVAMKLGFGNLQLQELLGKTVGYEKLTGAASGRIDVLGSGGSEDAIVRSLSGSANIAIGRGRFTGFDLQSLMNPDGGPGGITIFRDLAASFAITEGNMRSTDFATNLEVLKATGAGRIGLGAQDMDFTVTPKVGGETGGGISVPVRVHGPWSDLKYTPDLSRIEELRALEEQAKSAVQKKLSDELGTEVKTVEEAEDALRKRVEEEARKQLLKFLNGN